MMWNWVPYSGFVYIKCPCCSYLFIFATLKEMAKEKDNYFQRSFLKQSGVEANKLWCGYSIKNTGFCTQTLSSVQFSRSDMSDPASTDKRVELLKSYTTSLRLNFLMCKKEALTSQGDCEYVMRQYT